MPKKKPTNPEFSTEEKIALSVVGLFHVVGAGLLLFSKGGLYQVALDLVPINLIFTGLVIFKYQGSYSGSFFLFLILSYLTGLSAEIIGVNFGWLFGPYQYGEVLGLSIANTPLVIGLNWVLVSYGVGCFLQNLPWHPFLRWFAAVSLLLLFDYFLEPVAMKHDFWTWANGSVPIRNYIGWSVVSGLIMGYFHFLSFEKKNRVAGWVWGIQLVFFLFQNLF